MSQPSGLLDDAFGHHVWATLRLIDVCLELDDEALRAPALGTYGSILETMRHLVGADSWYLHVMSRGRVEPIEEEALDLRGLREAMERQGRGWSEVLGTFPDPSEDVVRRREDGSESHAPFGMRLAQVVHHGTDHRSQICTALTALGVEPPEIDVWDFGFQDGRVFEVPVPPTPAA
jgi:uncharacterized damage-inducible protein DinB